MRNVVDKKKE